MQYRFYGTNGTNGYVDNNNFMNGTLTLVVNSDGTMHYSFDGSIKLKGKTVAAKSGTMPVTLSNRFSTVSIPYVTMMENITGKTGTNMKFTDIGKMFNSYSDFSVTAFENTDASGTSGYTATLSVNAGSSTFSATGGGGIREGFTNLLNSLINLINGSGDENEAIGNIDSFLDSLGNRTGDEEREIYNNVVQSVTKFFNTVTAYLRNLFGM